MNRMLKRAVHAVTPGSLAVSRATTSSASAPRRVSVLGATGSVGLSTLDLIGRNAGDYQVVALTAQSNVERLAELARTHKAQLAVIGDERYYGALKAALAGTGVRVAAGAAALIEAAEQPVDWVMAAIVGAAGLRPTFAAAARRTALALANKECLVSAGEVFLAAVEAGGSTLLPVDSEHSAILQVIDTAAIDTIERIVLTASGGPFRTWSREMLASAGPEAALKHPNWTMGQKITIDSATLMNKGLELIEASHLFPVLPDRLGVIVHPQSIVHGLVEYADGSVLAHMGSPDMRTPIAYSLAWPRRMSAPTQRLDLTRIGQLTFEPPDESRFPALRICREALVRGGTACTILNAANEIAVEAFLDRRLSFYGIAELVERTLAEAERAGLVRRVDDLDEVLEADAEGRRMAQLLLGACT